MVVAMLVVDVFEGDLNRLLNQAVRVRWRIGMADGVGGGAGDFDDDDDDDLYNNVSSHRELLTGPREAVGGHGAGKRGGRR